MEIGYAASKWIPEDIWAIWVVLTINRNKKIILTIY